jgi:short-subunit dehydrogenase
MSLTLVVVGSGPGIGSSTAALFAARKFNKVALISRSSTRLQDDRQTVLASLPTARKVEVKTWRVDITETQKFETVLREIELFGDVSCVLFNAARVEPSILLEFAEEEIVKDFMVCALLHQPVGTID